MLMKSPRIDLIRIHQHWPPKRAERGEDQQLLLPPGSLTSRLTSIWSQFQHQQLHRPPTFRAVPPTATLTPSVGVLSDFTLQSNQLIEKAPTWQLFAVISTFHQQFMLIKRRNAGVKVELI